MPRKRKPTLDEIADALGLGAAKTDSHAYGLVKSVNADGTLQVALNDSSTTARCAPLASVGAKANDRVLVLRSANGRCIVLGKF